MHTYNIDLIRKIYDLKSELSPKSSYSYSFLDKNTKKGEKVWIKFYNGGEMQNQQFLLEVAENSPGNCTHIQTIVGNDGKTYKSVTGMLTIDGSIDTPDGQPTVVLYVSDEEESDSMMYRYSGEVNVFRTVIYDAGKIFLTLDIIRNEDEIIKDLNDFSYEVITWWNSICSKVPELLGHLKLQLPVDDSYNNPFPNPEEETDETIIPTTQ